MGSRDVLSNLVSRLDDPVLRELEVITWAAPILSFGDLGSSRAATLGLNPSNREFVDASGEELTGCDRRFHTLTSLGVKRWSDARDEHLERILDSCNRYFTGNPYDAWFRALEKLFVDADISYYGLFANACHLDLVPYSTHKKWGELASVQRSELLRISGSALGRLLKESDVEVLILNGQSVIENLQLICGCTFSREIFSDWILPRRSNPGVTGYAYTGVITQISGVDLGRQVSVLGYNHNIQSSFGVTNYVKSSIQKWVSQSAKEVFC